MNDLPPPLDDLALPGWAELPPVPNATLRVKLTLTDTPDGDQQRVDVRFVDGRRVYGEMVTGDWPELRDGDPGYGWHVIDVSVSFRNYLRLRSGQINALEAIEDGGTVDARWTILLLLHGLLQDRNFTALWQTLPSPADLGLDMHPDPT